MASVSPFESALALQFYKDPDCDLFSQAETVVDSYFYK